MGAGAGGRVRAQLWLRGSWRWRACASKDMALLRSHGMACASGRLRRRGGAAAIAGSNCWQAFANKEAQQLRGRRVYGAGAASATKQIKKALVQPTAQLQSVAGRGSLSEFIMTAARRVQGCIASGLPTAGTCEHQKPKAVGARTERGSETAAVSSRVMHSDHVITGRELHAATDDIQGHIYTNA
eukprot:363838-Chlamydomonas_euryale.AAC.6